MFVSIFAFTTLMDRHPSAFLAEAVKFTFGGLIIYLTGGWFGFENLFSGAEFLVPVYLILSLGAAYYFSNLKNRELAAN